METERAAAGCAFPHSGRSAKDQEGPPPASLDAVADLPPRDGDAASAEDVLRQRVKIELRKRMRGLRKALPASACAARSARIAEGLRALDAIARARRVALFWPIEERHEVDLRELDATLRAGGVRVAYPAVDRETGAMAFRFVDDPASMVEQGSGFREPPPDAPEAVPGGRDALDAIVVPALAVDPRGHRIGYGAGYYDRALPAHAPPAIAVAVAFDFQLVAEIGALPTDVPVAWIVTDARTLAAAKPD
jgi:5-formyltetrahydrofolate cyclo-ligase